MKICLNSWQDEELLLIADEIKLNYNERHSKNFNNCLNSYNKTFIIVVNNNEEILKEQLSLWKKLNKKIIMCVNNYQQAIICKETETEFYFNKPVSSYFELKALKQLGVRYVILDAPLFFDLNNVKKFEIPIRAIPNLSQFDFLPRKNGIHGTWIRPDNIDLYEDYIETIEFWGCDKAKEAALYDIYCIKKHWSGDCNYIFNDFNYNVYNGLILNDITSYRMNCRQKCEAGHSCYICDKIINMADENYIKEIIELKEE